MSDFSQGQGRRGQGRSLLARGISYLSRREHSEYELRKKLAPHAESPEELDEVMRRLKKENWQSDSRFLQATANVAAHKWGAMRIAAKLRQHHLSESDVNATLQNLQLSEYERAKAVWEKKFKGVAYASPQEYAKQMRFLLSRGFSPDVVRKIIRDPSDD
ncbi:recombination regulator RecX [Advenella mimigardefordensis]|uniref:Regulatory protein RecX n=1 Tax=Advenella mimigardefordensis (strain DSM 17166 / LMG 22922 / DPN7) TaxID=1247726 RepID=W0PFR4_ADVMD|nr:recombination regulator RecX [Advenella mimigardefordensis]AHG63903.1 regulatory protein RecX [Advenella mimigardefordensis DPN7]